MRGILGSVVHRWLELILPLYSIALLIVYFRPEYRPPVLSQGLTESPWPWLAWGMVGAMTGIWGLSALVALFFLLYSPVYLLNKSLLLVGKAGWVDRREVQFYFSCFLLLCLLVFLFVWNRDAFVVAGALMAGSAPVLWRFLV